MNSYEIKGNPNQSKLQNELINSLQDNFDDLNFYLISYL